MTNTEKISMISRMITDFWEFNETEDQHKGAMALITAICSVVDFGEDANVN